VFESLYNQQCLAGNVGAPMKTMVAVVVVTAMTLAGLVTAYRVLGFWASLFLLFLAAVGFARK
jgi:hypothetical protein